MTYQAATAEEVACDPAARELEVIKADTPVFVLPRVLPQKLTTFSLGTVLPVREQSGNWFLVRFQDPRWGRRYGYVQCADVITHVAVAAGDAPGKSFQTASGRPDSRRSKPSGFSWLRRVLRAR